MAKDWRRNAGTAVMPGIEVPYNSMLGAPSQLSELSGGLL